MRAAPDRTTLLVVAKAPVPGLAKTRLMSVLTAEQAATVAAASLLDTLDAVVGTRAARYVVALTGDLARATGRDALRRSLARFTVVDQRGDALGERLAAAHVDAGPGPVLQVGMDTPQLSSALLTEAAATLAEDDVDAVLGPAHDGGWWGLGVTEAALAQVLTGVPMSTDETGERTLAALRAAGARVALLEPLGDVDTPDDAAGVAALVPGSRFARAVAATGLLNPVAPAAGGAR